MKKFFLAIMFALIGMSASFAQELTITHNANVQGTRCMQFTCEFSVNFRGSVNLAVLIMDGNGNPVAAEYEDYEVDGVLGTTLEDVPVSPNDDMEANLYIPNDVLVDQCRRGASYYTYFIMLDDDGEVLMESEPYEFTIQ